MDDDGLDCEHVDIQCRTRDFEEGQNTAVGRLGFVDGGNSYVCSGTLPNDGDENATRRYLLTAHHCQPGYLTNFLASGRRSMRCDWPYSLKPLRQRARASVDYAFSSAKRSFGPCGQPQRRLGALATKVGEISRLATTPSSYDRIFLLMYFAVLRRVVSGPSAKMPEKTGLTTYQAQPVSHCGNYGST